MSCYCKETAIDKSEKSERPKNLYEEDDDDYNETYMDELVTTIELDKTIQQCGSTPSLPEVAVASDRCESKMEIPWLKISLAPPGFYEIKTMQGRPKRVVCDCWNLSANDEIYTEPVKVHEEEEEPLCKCRDTASKENNIGDAEARGLAKDNENAVAPDENAEKPDESETAENPDQNTEKPDENTENPDTNTENPDANTENPDPNTENPDPNTENPDENTEKPDENTENPDPNAETPDENTEKPDETTENPDENTEKPDENTENPDTSTENPDANTENPDTNTENPDENTEKPDENTDNPDENIEKPDENTENPDENTEKPDESLPPPDGGTEKPVPSSSEEDSDSSSVPSSCICIPPRDECADFLGKPTIFVYDNPCFAQNESYLDPIYRLYPDDCDTYCGPHIEMPWSDLIIPRNIKLRNVKKNTNQKKSCKCDDDKQGKIEDKQEKQEEIVTCGEKEEALVPTTDKSGSVALDAKPTDKSFEIQLSFTEIVSKMAVEDKAAPAGVSVSIKPCREKCSITEPSTTTHIERGSVTEPPVETSRERSTMKKHSSRASDYSGKSSSCRCRTPKSKTPSSSKSSKCKNPSCKSSNRDISASNIESTTSGGSKCGSPNCKSQSPARKSKNKSCYQEHVMNVLETCEAEMEPLRDTLNQLKSKIRNLNIPELNNWNGNTMQCPPDRSVTNTPGTMPLVKQPSSQMGRPPFRPPPSQDFFFMQPPPQQPPLPPQFNFSPPLADMFPSMPPMQLRAPTPTERAQFRFPPPLGQMLPPAGGCCPMCACKDVRPRKKYIKNTSSSTDYSEYDSLSDGESLCPFLRALSSKNVYKDPSRSQRKGKNQENQKKSSHRQSKKSESKKHNKKNQVERACHDICTDTEPEIQVHYGPKYPRVKTKQVFKGLVDPSMAISKNQRLRIAVKVTPSGQVMRDDKQLAIQGPSASR